MIGLPGGTLRHRVILQRRVESSRDSDGGIAESWSTEETFWAGVAPVSGRERLVAEQMSSEVTHLVMRRYKAGITSKDRLLYGIRASVSDYVSGAGSPWTRVASGSSPFSEDMVGQYITITAGTDWIQGDYRIVEFVSGAAVFVDRAVAAQNVTGGTGFVNRQLEIDNVVDLKEDGVTTEIQCIERVT